MQMPSPDIYDQSLQYWPFNTTLRAAIGAVARKAPPGGKVLDIMCGSGYLLGELQRVRKDLSLDGADIEYRYVQFCRNKYPGMTFHQADVLAWIPPVRYDMVVCTGALHHVPYDMQERAVKQIASMLAPNGTFILADCYVGDYSNERERQLAAAELGHAYLMHTIKMGAPAEVLRWTAEITSNDVLGEEFKTSAEKRYPILQRYFTVETERKTWPLTADSFGEYLHTCTVR